MPFFDEKRTPQDLANIAPADEPELDPSLGETFGAAFRTQNIIGSWLSSRGAPDPYQMDEDFNSIDYVKDDPKYAPYVDEFAGIFNRKAADALKLQIDREEQDRRTLDAAGASGVVAQMAAGVVDLPTLLPLGGAISVGGRGLSAGVGAAIGAGIDAAVSEAGLQATQTTRTGAESALNIGGSIILGGALGALAGRYLGTASQVAIGRKIEGQGAAFDEVDKAFVQAGKPQSAGAAARDTGPLVLKDEALISKLPLVNRQDPLIRLQLSELDAGRQTVRGLAETPLEYADNAAGVATELGGSVETRMKMWNAPLARSLREIDTVYARYFHGTPEPSSWQVRLSPLRSEFERMRGGDKLTYKQFKEEVGRAAYMGGQHEIPEVASAAKVYRKIDDDLKQAAIDARLFPEDIDVAGDISHRFRMYNREKIIAERGRFASILHDYFTAGQAAAQVRAAEGRAARLALRIQDATKETTNLQTKLDGLEARIRERTAAYEATLTKGNGEKLGVTEKQFDLLQSRRDSIDELTSEYRAAEALFHESADRYKLLADEFDQLPEEVAKSQRVKMALDYAKAQQAKAEKSAKIAKLRQKELSFRLSKQKAKADDVAREIASIEFELSRAIANVARLEGIFAKTGKYFTEAGAAKTEEFADLLPGEIASIVDETIDTILGHAEGRIPYDIVAGPRGALKDRMLKISTAKIHDFVENDIETVLHSQMRTMSADIELAKKFGSVDLKEEIAKVNDEANAKIAKAETPKERQRLEKARKDAIRDIEGIRDRLRGTYALPSNPDSLVLRAGRVARNLNYLRLLGGMTVSAIPDMAKVVFTHGLVSTFRDGFVPMIRNFKAFRAAAEEVKLAGTALDMVLDSRTMAMADIMDDFGRHSKFERGLKSLSTKFGVVSLMAPWNASMKQFAGLVTMTNILKAAERVSKGQAIKGDVRKLAAAGINEDLAQRITKQFADHGTDQSGVLIAGGINWTDRQALEAFRAAVVRDVDRIVVTPGQDKPLWMSTELGKAVGQFKSFGVSSMQKTMLAGIQQRDAAVLNGTLMTLGLGAMVYWLKQTNAGQPVSDDPAVWAVEALDKSGLTGWLMEVNNIAEKASRGRVGLSALTGKQVSRYATRNVTGAFLGPTADAVSDIFQVSGSIFAGDTTKSDLHKVRQLLPMQNLFYIRSLLNQVEEATGDTLGLPDKRN